MKLAFDLYSPPGGEDGSKPPVILLHGRLDSRKTWKKLGPRIAETTGRKVFALDARNHGESPWSNEMDVEILANDVEEFMRGHEIPRAIFIGHSMGGKTAIAFALLKPDKVEKLIVEDMTVKDTNPKVKSTVANIIILLRKSLDKIPSDCEELTAKKAVYDFMESFIPPGVDRDFMFVVGTLPLKKSGSGYAWQANLDVLEDTLKNRPSPTFTGVYEGDALFLYGNKSFFEVEKDESITKYFPRAVKVCVEGAGHLIHQDYPDEFMKEVLKFI